MLWKEIRKAYTGKWLFVEALEAHTTPDRHRHLDRMAVVEKCTDGSLAMKGHRRLYQKVPGRMFYFVHMSRGELEIRERQWLGIAPGWHRHQPDSRFRLRNDCTEGSEEP